MDGLLRLVSEGLDEDQSEYPDEDEKGAGCKAYGEHEHGSQSFRGWLENAQIRIPITIDGSRTTSQGEELVGYAMVALHPLRCGLGQRFISEFCRELQPDLIA